MCLCSMIMKKSNRHLKMRQVNGRMTLLHSTYSPNLVPLEFHLFAPITGTQRSGFLQWRWGESGNLHVAKKTAKKFLWSGYIYIYRLPHPKMRKLCSESMKDAPRWWESFSKDAKKLLWSVYTCLYSKVKCHNQKKEDTLLITRFKIIKLLSSFC